MRKRRVHWTLPPALLDRVTEIARALDRTEPYVVERLLAIGLDKGMDTTSGQARELADAIRGAK